jgi:hypothetical protein
LSGEIDGRRHERATYRPFTGTLLITPNPVFAERDLPLT